MARGFRVVVYVLSLLAAAALQCKTATASPVAKATGAKMCVLTASDFRKFGTVVWSKPTANIDQNGETVYCVYRGKSGATGGVELDVFYPAGSAPADIEQTFKTVMGADPGGVYRSEKVPGADEYMYSLSVPQSGYFPFAANDVRRGDLVFSISLPSSPLAKTELLQLSEAVLQRLSK